ncbi:MAG: MFS transporter [Acidobacteriota bacterium]
MAAAKEPKSGPRRNAPDARRTNERRNLAVFLAHGLLGMTGFRLLQAPTFLPSYISILTGSSAAVGAARAVQSLGMFLSPLIGAGLIEARPRAKRLALAFGVGTRLQILLLAVLALFAPEGVARWGVWIAIGCWGLFNGLQGVTFNELIAKTVPLRSRGRLVGLRNLTAGLSLLVVSAFAGWVLDRTGYPRGYGFAFLLSFVLAGLGLLALAFLEEGETVDRRPPISLRQRLREVPKLLGSSRDFSGYIRARLCATAARGALPFYVLAVSERFGISGARLAGLTVAFTLSQSFSALPWGWLGDRAGYRRVYLMGQALWVTGNVVMLTATALPAAYAVFFCVGAGMSGTLIANQNLVLEFGEARDRPMRIATSNSLAEALGAFGFLAAGALAQFQGLTSVFVASLLLQVTGIYTLSRISDPRHRSGA